MKTKISVQTSPEEIAAIVKRIGERYGRLAHLSSALVSPMTGPQFQALLRGIKKPEGISNGAWRDIQNDVENLVFLRDVLVALDFEFNPEWDFFFPLCEAITATLNGYEIEFTGEREKSSDCGEIIAHL